MTTRDERRQVIERAARDAAERALEAAARDVADNRGRGVARAARAVWRVVARVVGARRR